MELGVERVARPADAAVSTKASKSRWSDEPAVARWAGRSRYGSIPVEIGCPASTQAIVPPATLTASMPWAR